MILTVHVRPEAEADIDDAAVWYETQRMGLGQDFLDETLCMFDTILRNPHMYSVLHRQTRRAIMHCFPFGVFYRIEGDSIVVIAVLHGSRHPSRWKERT